MEIFIDNRLIVRRVDKANTFFKRFKGLMCKENLADDVGLLLIPCSGVHTFFMRFAIDVVYLNHNNVIIAVFYNVPPWKMLPLNKKCYSVLEIKAGVLPKDILGKKCSFNE